MERVYALGITCIEYIQTLFADCEPFFEVVNNLSDPNNVLEVVFPVISIVDSVFAGQLCLCIAFGTWLNAVMKWQLHVRWWKLVVVPASGAALGAVMLARMFVATHFPHQVLLGALIGAFLAPALCIYVVDPYVWQYGYHEAASCRDSRLWHVVCAALTAAIALVTYLMLHVCGWDPLWTIKLAFRWCEHPDSIRVSSTPMYALVHATGHMLGWALCVTPQVTKYRHYTADRSLLLSGLATALVVYTWKHLQSHISTQSAAKFYATHFLLCTLRPPLYLRAIPALAMWPYRGAVSAKKKQ